MVFDNRKCAADQPGFISLLRIAMFQRSIVLLNRLVFICAAILLGTVTGSAQGPANYTDVRAKFFAGEYDECEDLARLEVDRGVWNDLWSRLLIETLLETGQYEQARDVYELVAQKFSGSLPLRVLGAEAYRYCGQPERGDALISQIPALVDAAPWRFSDRDNMLAIGRFLLDAGEDARVVLTNFYDRSLKLDPEFVEAHVAVAELALDKADYQEAVRALGVALELRPTDPQIPYLLSRAWAPSDSEKATEYLQRALTLNPRHVPSLLTAARVQIDREAYVAAEQLLGEALAVNPLEPQAWALRAAIAHLQGNYQSEGEYRSKALGSWPTNPRVDYMVGETLSKHYRFSESEQYQRRALKLDPAYLPARFQLAQDLLRLGATDEGWSIVDQVAQADVYNVVAYNLKTLQKNLAEFRTLEAPGLLVRMHTQEAQLYGGRVLSLLQVAREQLCNKYAVELEQPIVVEIFPQQSDFAIRTFGLPGGAGYLGVCFGNLITANSPASQGDSPSNWESVLWHEFCHVVTLNKTKNRMPRWLSEGISVYEELERDPSWGQRMDPVYKRMILGEDFVPLSKLSGAFMQPKSPMHLQFAYFESSLAVRYLIAEHGLPRLLRLLDSLGLGLPVEEAFEQLYGDAGALDADFARYATAAAQAFAKDATFEQGDLPPRATGEALKEVLEKEPGHYLGWQYRAREAIEQKNWDAALEAAMRLIELYPDDTSEGSGLSVQATVARATENKELERKSLSELVSYASDNVPVLLRLLELTKDEQDWEAHAQAADKLLAVQPLIAAGHVAQATAGEQLGRYAQAVAGYQALLALDPIDMAGLRFQLASALYRAEQFDEARVEVLQALEDAPRYRAAQRLLVEIHRAQHPPVVEPATANNIDRDAAGTLQADVPDDLPPPKPEN